MKKLFKKVGAFLRKTWVWTLLLVLFVALLVWFAGPLLAVDDYKFWEGSTSRLLTISVLFLIFLKLFPVIPISEVKELVIHDRAHGSGHHAEAH